MRRILLKNLNERLEQDRTVVTDRDLSCERINCIHDILLVIVGNQGQILGKLRQNQVHVILQAARAQTQQGEDFCCVSKCGLTNLVPQLLKYKRQHLGQVPLELYVHHIRNRLHEVD